MIARVCAIIASIALALGLVPAAVAEEQTWGIWVAGTQVTAANKDDVFRNNTVRFDPDSATLYLNSARLLNAQDIEDENGRIPEGKWDQVPTISITEKNLTLHITGDNRILNKPTSPGSGILFHKAGPDSTLTFTGDGSITFSRLPREKPYEYFHVPVYRGVETEGQTKFAGPNVLIEDSGLSSPRGITVAAGDVVAHYPSGYRSATGVSVWDGDLRISGGSLTGIAGSKSNSGYSGDSYAGVSAVPDRIFITGGKLIAISTEIAFRPTVTFPETYKVLVNEKNTAEGAKPWDRTTPLGDKGSPYKFVQIELADSPQPPAEPTTSAPSTTATESPTTQPTESANPTPTTTSTPKESDPNSDLVGFLRSLLSKVLEFPLLKSLLSFLWK
ncbi:hypothetical protein [Corynebacterium mustelae]|nr:hypothetical protein [Corynebacterium mustelae]